MRVETSQTWSNQLLTPACERAQIQISRHIDGELSHADGMSLRGHLGACPSCRKALELQTAHSKELAETFRTLWPGESEIELKKKTSAAPDSSERWISTRRLLLRAASILAVIVGLIVFAKTTRALVIQQPATRNSTASK